MVDWNAPTLTTLYDEVLTSLKGRDVSISTMTYTSDSNVTVGAVRRNSSDSNKLEEWNGSAWVKLAFHTTIDNHIADTAIHAGVPTGSVFAYPGSSAPSGYLLCQGQAISRTTYAALFAITGISYGAGDGSTTFNIPDLRQRFPLGKAASGTGATLGGTGGSIDHTHTTPAHTHTIPTHTHTMANHTHSVGSHTHGIPSHTHTIPAHYHGKGTLAITGGGHSHALSQSQVGGFSADPSNPPSGIAGHIQGGSAASSNHATTADSHSHPSGEFSGNVGNTGGSDGDSTMTSGATSATSDASSAFNTGVPSTNTTDGSGTLTTNSGGSGTSGSNNPPYQVVNYIIKT